MLKLFFSEKIGFDHLINSFYSVLIKYFTLVFYAHAEICRFSKEKAILFYDMASFQNATQGINFI